MRQRALTASIGGKREPHFISFIRSRPGHDLCHWALADPLSNEMASMNARWDAAINSADFNALLPMYTSDASLMPSGAQPVTGPTAIRDFFAGRGRSVQNHKLELVNVVALGNFAYVTSHFTATLEVNKEAKPISGSTVRLLERQSDGEWKIKSHIFVRE